MRRRHKKHESLRAFTLLEVILALAILAGSIAVIGEVMSVASRSAADAQAESEAQLLASSVMDEMLSGYVPLTQQTRQPVESSSSIPWVCSVTLAETSFVGLTSVEVLIEQDVEKQFRPVKYRLVRWFVEDSSSEETEGETTDNAEDGSDA